MPDYIVKCKNEECGQVFKTDMHNVEYCSTECQKTVVRKKNQEKSHKRNAEKYKDVPNIPTCKVCGFKSVSLILHINDIHNMSQKTYMRKFKAKLSDIYHSSYTDKVKTHGVGKHANCKYCGTEFEKITPRRDYCSSECQKKAQKERRASKKHVPVGTEKECKQCGAKFKQVKRKPHSAFCRPRCRNRWFYEKKKQEAVKEPVIKTCKFCFTPLKPKSRKQFCDDECKRFYGNTKRLNKLIEQHEEKYGNIPDIPKCKICGFKAQNLHRHIKNYHFITIEEYCEKYDVERESLVYKELIELHRKNSTEYFEKEMAKHMEKHKKQRSG